MSIPVATGPASSGVTNAQKTAATGPGRQDKGASNDVMGFIAALLQQGQAQNAQQAPTDGKSDDQAALLEKISALLKQNGGKLDLKSLQALLPADQAQALADKLAALQKQQADAFMPTLMGDKPASGLTSDLSGALAPTAQQDSDAQNDDMLTQLAAQLNALQPGDADAAQDADAQMAQAAQSAQRDAQAALLALQAAKPEQTASPLAQQAATAQAAALRASTSKPDAGAQAPAKAADAASGVPDDGSARGITLSAADNSTANGGKGSVSADLARAQAPATQQAAAQTAQAAQAGAAKAELPAHLSMVNSLLGANLGSDSGSSAGFDGGDQGFGQQNTFGQTAANAYGTGDTTALKAGQANQTPFINYMSQARGASPTTQMVGVQMTRNANSQIDSFTMQLDPADLGRLEVRMNFGKDGKMSAQLIADKPETLHMLQRDQAHLERILQQSGLDMGDGALSFDLRGGNQQSLYEGGGSNRGNDGFYAGRGDNALNDNTMTAQIAVQSAGYISQSGVNIMV